MLYSTAHTQEVVSLADGHLERRIAREPVEQSPNVPRHLMLLIEKEARHQFAEQDYDYLISILRPTKLSCLSTDAPYF